MRLKKMHCKIKGKPDGAAGCETLKINSQLNLALHTLGHMAASDGNPMTSEDLALCSNTNPVVIRRLLGVLRRADLVSSARGRSGGWTLTRQANAITLGQIHTALQPALKAPALPHSCKIANRLDTRLTAALTRAQNSMNDELNRTTLADLV